MKPAAVTSHTCQVSSELSEVSAEVVKLDLRCQEDVLRFRKWERALVCAGILVECNQKSNMTVGIRNERCVVFNLQIQHFKMAVTHCT